MTPKEQKELREKVKKHLIELTEICREYNLPSIDTYVKPDGHAHAFALNKGKDYLDLVIYAEENE